MMATQKLEKLPGAVLFACNLNSVRSPMAEGLVRHFFKGRVFVDSVGVESKQIDPFAVDVMAEMDIDMSGHQSKTFDDLQDLSFDLIIALSPEARDRALELTKTVATEVLYWEIDDPTDAHGNRDQRLETFAQVRDDLMARIFACFGEPDAVQPD